MLTPAVFLLLIFPSFLTESFALGFILRVPAMARTRATFILDNKRSGAVGVGLGSTQDLDNSGQEEGKTSVALKEDSFMTAKQIKSELSQLGISFQDCFDKESLLQRLREARQLQQKDRETTKPLESREDTSSSRIRRLPAIKEEYRKLRVSELRTMLGEQGIRWSNMIEKEDLVNALALRKLETENFSVSQSLIPGKVNEVNGDTLSLELEQSTAYVPPLLLDGESTSLDTRNANNILNPFTFPFPFTSPFIAAIIIFILDILPQSMLHGAVLVLL